MLRVVVVFVQVRDVQVVAVAQGVPCLLYTSQEVQADFADAIQAQLQRRSCAVEPTSDDQLRFAVTARCIAAAVFGAMEVWMLSGDRSLGELARVCHLALESLRAGINEAWADPVSS